MTIQDTYIRFLDLANRNATNNRVNVDKPRFIMMYNDIQRRYVEWVLEKRNEDEIRYIQLLLVNDKQLTVKDNRQTYTSYSLPVDYFDFSNVSIQASSSCCPKVRMTAFEVKSENREELLTDEFNKPSIDYAETFYYFSDNSILIYKDNFDISNVKLTYYRYPRLVDIGGYINLNNAPSTDIHPEFDDKVVNRIIIGMAKEFSAINSDSGQYNADKDRLFTKI